MPRRSDICTPFDYHMFRFYCRKRFSEIQEFADKSGFPYYTVVAWHCGQHKPTWKRLFKIAETLEIPPRDLLIKGSRVAFDKWMDHTLDFLHAPPETINETSQKKRDGMKGSFEESGSKKTERQLKLTEKGAIEVSERLGIFDERHATGDIEVSDAEKTDGDLLEQGDAPDVELP